MLGWRAAPIPRNALGRRGCCCARSAAPATLEPGVHQRPAAPARPARGSSPGRGSNGSAPRRACLWRASLPPDGTTLDAGDAVVVAAGATETPGLLRRSGLGGHRAGPQPLRCTRQLLAGLFDDDASRGGVPQSAAVHDAHESDGVLTRPPPHPPGMGSMVFPAADVYQRPGAAASQHSAMVADQRRHGAVGARR